VREFRPSLSGALTGAFWQDQFVLELNRLFLDSNLRRALPPATRLGNITTVATMGQSVASGEPYFW
jgi:hypothetical protein